MTDAIANFVTVLGHIGTTITGSPILYAMFAGVLFIVGAKVFKRIKNAAK